ncbi:MAG: SlyX family protein [Rudaea sp.]
MNPTLEERLNELEVRFAFLEHAMQSLDATVTGHDRLLSEMREAFARVRGELSQVKVALAHDVRDEPTPPHY